MLDHLTTPAERMADALIALNADGYQDHQDIYLSTIYGFSGREIAAHRDEAVRLANRRFVRTLSENPPAYDRDARLRLARSIALGLLPGEGLLHAQLRNAGLTNAELAEFWGEIVAVFTARAQSLRGPSPENRRAPARQPETAP